MNPTTDRKPLDLEDVELVRTYGYSVTIDNDDLDTPLPHFHKFTRTDDNRTSPVPSTPIPVVHAVRFAVPCERCYPVEP